MLPALKGIWQLTILIPLICGTIVTLTAGQAFIFTIFWGCFDLIKAYLNRRMNYRLLLQY